MTRIRTLDRRDFLKLGGTVGGGLALAVTFTPGAARGLLASEATAAAGLQPNAFLHLDPDGTVTIWCAKSDMGQGVRTALPMIVADEMDADWSQVRIEQADAHPDRYGRQMTVGSSSVRRGGWDALRQAGATAREMLVAAAATSLGVPASELRTESGRVLHDATGQAADYGTLADAAGALPVPEEPRLKTPEEFVLIGTSVPQGDTDAKVTGQAVYGIDVDVAGMRYATVVRPRVLGGSLAGMDEAAARAVPGVRDVFEVSSGVAVVADHTWAAFEGARALNCTWSGDFRMSSPDIERHNAELLEGDGVIALDEGDASAALSSAEQVLEATYTVPYLAHATMEPMNATAHVTDDRCEVWAPTQNPQGAQRAAAEITGLPVEDVTVHVTFMGCGWGRRSMTDFVEDAVEVSQWLGEPVQVLWTREEDIRGDWYRPASSVRFRGGVAGGRLRGLEARVASPPLGVTNDGGEGEGVDRNSVDGVITMTYDLPDFRVEYCRSTVQVPTYYWRSVGPSGNGFMVESFIDELAHAAGRDPLDFRLEMLNGHPRMRHVLEVAAERAGWGGPVPEARARGIGIVEDKGGIVAQIAEVSVEGGAPVVHRVWCVADCGQIIHPAIVEGQLAGSVVAGLTMALYGEITVEEGRVVQGNFDDYRLLRMAETPEIDVHIIPSREAPGGVGEPAVPPIAPAVTNALFALTGHRIRSLPIRLS